VIVGAHRPPLSTLQEAAADGRLSIVDNVRWSEGQSTSLQAAVAEAERRHAHAIVVGLADQPFVEPSAWRAVAASNWPIAVAEYPEGWRNPVRLHRSVWPLLPTTGDQGARQLLRLRAELVEPVPCAGSPADIDTLEDLRSWQNRSSTNSP
jgi:CTP:molybdopterin cytidylyltransferase MocA